MELNCQPGRLDLDDVALADKSNTRRGLEYLSEDGTHFSRAGQGLPETRLKLAVRVAAGEVLLLRLRQTILAMTCRGFPYIFCLPSPRLAFGGAPLNLLLALRQELFCPYSAEFRFRFPPGRLVRSAGQAMKAATIQSGRSLRVLVVEDDVGTTESLSYLLGLDGHEVQVAPDGQAAIQACTNRWPDVVLLDLALPLCDGYQVAGHIRQQSEARPPRPFVVVISGYATQDDRLRSGMEGADLHFAKPMDPELLLKLLRRFAAVRLDPADVQ
jgi:CheY-like chemotaxis protein